jgi:ADP-ribosylglycohydrolase
LEIKNVDINEISGYISGMLFSGDEGRIMVALAVLDFALAKGMGCHHVFYENVMEFMNLSNDEMLLKKASEIIIRGYDVVIATTTICLPNIPFVDIEFTKTISKINREWQRQYPEELNSPDKKVGYIYDVIIGQAVGDAIGFLVEGFTSKKAQEFLKDDLDKICDLGLHKSFSNPRYCISDDKDCVYKFGQYTDDTQMARELLRSINGWKFNREEYAKRVLAMYSNAGLLGDYRYGDWLALEVPPIVGYGTAGLKASKKIMKGYSWKKCGTVETSGNGGCMRSGVIGALYYDDPDMMESIAKDQCLITHANARCMATAVLIAEAVRIALESRILKCQNYDLSKHPEIFSERLAKVMLQHDIEVSKVVSKIPTFLKNEGVEGIVEGITRECSGLGEVMWHGGKAISVSAVQASVFAICCFLRHPDSYMEAICLAISGGGDTDTTAAMCGAILGARLGAKAIPEKYTSRINDGGEWNRESLMSLCEISFKGK